MDHVFAFLLTGAAFGLMAGLTPGPLMMLIFAQTLGHGPREGVKVALAPLITDGPIMLAYLFALQALASTPWVMAVISALGGFMVLRFGWGCITAAPLDMRAPGGPAGSWSKGVLTNAFNPKMHLFWATVGSPTLLAAVRQGAGPAAAYLVSFYLCLVGSCLGLAWLCGRFTRFLSGPAYVWTMRGLGLMLWLAAAGLFLEAAAFAGLFNSGLARPGLAG